jgi:hypothetical protein
VNDLWGWLIGNSLILERLLVLDIVCGKEKKRGDMYPYVSCLWSFPVSHTPSFRGRSWFTLHLSFSTCWSLQTVIVST